MGELQEQFAAKGALEAVGTPTLQEQLDTFLSYAEGTVLLWHDPDARYTAALGGLSLPADTVLLREDITPRFELRCRVNEPAPDERILLYRSRGHRVEERDWFADLEACAECFEVEGDAAFEVAGEASVVETESTPEQGPEPEPAPVAEPVPAPAPAFAPAAPAAEPSPTSPTDDALAPLRAVVTEDWVARKAFQHAIRTQAPSLADTPLDQVASRLGYTLHQDCILRSVWHAPADYYASLLSGELVPRENVPHAVQASSSFKAYLRQCTDRLQVLDYDASTWITRAGLEELGIDRGTLIRFGQEVTAACDRVGLPYLTLPWLRREGGDIELLRYELPDAFYVSALKAKRLALGHSTVCGQHLFSVRNAVPRGREFVAALVAQEQSLQVDELLEILQEDYGIPVERPQLATLARDAGLYQSPEFDRIFINHDQYIREME